MKTINTLKKVSLATFLTFVLSFSSVFAQNDTMYIMKSGAIAGQYNVNTEVDSVIFYKPTIEETTSGTFIDSRDGNEYNWVQIGDQVWMAENLAYLPEVVHSNDEFKTQSSNGQPGYGIYGYDGNDVATAKLQSNYTTYGVLYNWYAAMNGAESSMANPSGVQGVCPDGWHLPSDDEWHELIDNLGGRIIAGGALKAIGTVEAGTGLWYEPNAEATNETGFTALPGGFRNRDGGFGSDDGVTTLGYIGYTGHWWSTTVLAPLGKTVLPQFMSSGFGGTNGSTYDKGLGFSVRCIRD